MRSRLLSGKSTIVSILSVNGPLTEKRLRWINNTGGKRDSERFFVALRNALHFGQCLRQVEGSDRCRIGRRWTYHASDFSSTSSLTNASKHEYKETFDGPLMEGIGKDKYMNEL